MTIGLIHSIIHHIDHLFQIINRLIACIGESHLKANEITYPPGGSDGLEGVSDFRLDKNIPREYRLALSLATGKSRQEVFNFLIIEVYLRHLLPSGFGLNQIPDVCMKLHLDIITPLNIRYHNGT